PKFPTFLSYFKTSLCAMMPTYATTPMKTKRNKKITSSLIEISCHETPPGSGSLVLSSDVLVELSSRTLTTSEPGGTALDGKCSFCSSACSLTGVVRPGEDFLQANSPSHLGGASVRKKHLKTTIVANKTNEMRTSVSMTILPSIGISIDETGKDSGTTSKYTIRLSNSVVTKPILSPLSDGMRKLNIDNIVRIQQGPNT
ncbi:hypothetical protein AC249_AIPGENE32, partial [Exaiptasia diaphana]